MSLICFHVFKMCSQLLNMVISRTSMIRHTVERNHEETRPPIKGPLIYQLTSGRGGSEPGLTWTKCQQGVSRVGGVWTQADRSIYIFTPKMLTHMTRQECLLFRTYKEAEAPFSLYFV